MTETITFEERWKTPPEPGDRLWSVYATAASRERQASQARGYQAIRSLWLNEIAGLPLESTVKVWDVQNRLEEANPSLADYVGIVLGDLEDRGLVDVTIDGKLQRTELTQKLVL
jgi:hypothetical protein